MAQIRVSTATPVQSLPQAPTRAADAAPAQAAPETALQDGEQLVTYTVKKGDNLWNISKAHLGDATKWPSIHNLNRGQIKNPDLIYPNQVLRLPILVQQPAVPATPQPTPSEPAVPAPTQPVAPANPSHPVISPVPAHPAKPSLGKDVGKAAAIGGAIGAAGTIGTLAVITARLGAPLSNLGGYGTAQVVAAKLASFGLHVPQGPALTKLVASVGGPKVAAAGVAVGVGLAAAGLAAGGYYLYRKASDK
ncbi:MAG: LysM peptidoglycan-binding domain-containing protein [Candidatus Sericytochromatia bacterium]